MRVVFTKGPGTSYDIAVHRAAGPALAPRNGPGGHPYLPHDLVHFLVEAEAGIALGVYGRLAAGDNGLFWPADPAERAKAARHRRSKRPRSSPRARADMARSEELAGLAVPVWELRRGLRETLPAYVKADALPPVVDRIVARLDTCADRWHALEPGDSLELTW
ncbi:hypothetical protein [Streptomyces capillispiralis]|uniref:Uncharacterized protein n=1 Tax=Streptomyces capillispiralis TaxID=68182 RepID=A0A561TI43_9ACTN|nr:hypothetical protein [Streptomyces capillispiralis]TWF86797.1 hypothetical protein FHX78_113788 [Streptomyces capillispiralis]GHH90796.1 hypothetical protein GCM10017779_12530 [Streptomyces capillispiralis]